MPQRKLTHNEMTGKDDDGTETINVINEAEQPYNDEIAMRAVNELFNAGNLESNSRIKPEQVLNLSRLYAFSEIFSVSLPRLLADHILKLQISLNGYGRQEIVQLVQQRNMGIIEKPITSKDIFK